MKSRGFFQTPQDIIEEYNGCSVPQYTAYPLFVGLGKKPYYLVIRRGKIMFMLEF
jgi:hypothetical protein